MIDGRITRRAPEKRQRALISTHYDEGMQNVNHSLQEISQALQKLFMRNTQQPPESPKSSSAFLNGNQLSTLSRISESYEVDSSLKHMLNG